MQAGWRRRQHIGEQNNVAYWQQTVTSRNARTAEGNHRQPEGRIEGVVWGRRQKVVVPGKVTTEAEEARSAAKQTVHVSSEEGQQPANVSHSK